MIMKRADRRDRWVGILALASAFFMIASACASPSPAASNLAGATSSATTTAASSPTAAATASPTRAPRPTPIPAIPSTTQDATEAPPGAVSIKMAWEAARFVQAYKSAILTVEGLTPGTYTFWCEVPGHAANGMVGTLKITG